MSRTIIIEFGPPTTIFKGEDKSKVFQTLLAAKQKASSVIGKIIQLSHDMYDQHENLEATISQAMPTDLFDNVELLPRITDTYSIWLYSMIKV